MNSAIDISIIEGCDNDKLKIQMSLQDNLAILGWNNYWQKVGNSEENRIQAIRSLKFNLIL